MDKSIVSPFFDSVYICFRSVIWIRLDLGRHLVIIVDRVGLGHRVDGLDWIGFRKLDARPTLRPLLLTLFGQVCMGLGCYSIAYTYSRLSFVLLAAN